MLIEVLMIMAVKLQWGLLVRQIRGCASCSVTQPALAVTAGAGSSIDGAYSHISLTLGELAAWLVVTTLVLVSESGAVKTISNWMLH